MNAAQDPSDGAQRRGYNMRLHKQKRPLRFFQTEHFETKRSFSKFQRIESKILVYIGNEWV
jgi:hypothetical protein